MSVSEAARQIADLLSPSHVLTEPDGASRTILDALPVAVYVTDAEGRITYFNRAAGELAGREPELGRDRWCVAWRLYNPDGTPLPLPHCPMAVALKERRAVRGVEAILERPDGTRIPLLPYPTPLFNQDGELVGAVNVLVDITERKRAELLARVQGERLSTLTEARQLLAAIVESSDDAIASKDLNGIIVSWNKGAERLFGYAADEIIGRSVMILIPPDRQDEEPKILERIRRGERIEHFETVRRRKDGSLIDISLTVSPVRNEQGMIIGASKIARDITERKAADAQRELLVAELNHRVKNTLATVLSIANQSFSRNRPLDEVRHSFNGRVRALAQTHDRLAEGLWSGVSFETLVRDELAPYCREDGRNVRVQGPQMTLTPRHAVLVGMAIHELATNAAKYGALSATSGIVDISWEIDQPRSSVVIRWAESGGPKVRPPESRGFGRMLLERALAADLGGRVEMSFAEKGLICEIAMPIDERIVSIH